MGKWFYKMYYIYLKNTKYVKEMDLYRYSFQNTKQNVCEYMKQQINLQKALVIFFPAVIKTKCQFSLFLCFKILTFITIMFLFVYLKENFIRRNMQKNIYLINYTNNKERKKKKQKQYFSKLKFQ